MIDRPYVSFDDGDDARLRVHEVYGFGYPSLVLSVTQEGDYSGVLVNQENAILLRDFLTAFIDKHKEGK